MQRYRDNLTALGAAQKPGGGVPAYLRWVNRPLGRRAAAWGDTVGMTPNRMTAVSAVVSLAGIVVLAGVAHPAAGLGAALLLLIGYVLDSADGQLARLQRRGGPAGEWLDHVVDGIRAPLVHIAVVVHVQRTDQPSWVALVALAFSVLVSAWFLSQLLAEKLGTRVGGPRSEVPADRWQSWIRQPQDPSTTYVLLVLLAFPALFAVCYTALFGWQLSVFVGSLRRKYRSLQAP